MENLTIEQIERKLRYGIHKLIHSKQWQDYLQFSNSFHEYSYHNCMLIYMQRPYATYVASYQTWVHRYNRYVKKREKGIRIIAPIFDNHHPDQIIGYRNQYVFDISQTVGKPLPIIKPALQQDTHPSFSILQKMLESISPVPITYIKMKKSGSFQARHNQIKISNQLTQAQTIKTMIHEIAHAYMHNLNADGFTKDRAIKEIEAESVAYIVCYHLGLDVSTFSFPYIANWQCDQDITDITTSLKDIQKTAHDIICNIDGQFDSLNQLSDSFEPIGNIVQLPVSSSISS